MKKTLKEFFEKSISFFTTPFVRIPRSIFFVAPLALLFVFGAFVYAQVSPPLQFPKGKIISLPEGVVLRDISRILKEEGVIRSPYAFEISVHLLGDARSLRFGEYVFHSRFFAYEVAQKILTAEYGIEPIRVTIPEGATSYEIAGILERRLYNFDGEAFAELAVLREGYLFPETYFIMPTATPEQVLAIMEQEFSKRIVEVLPEIEEFGITLHEALTMASLLEKEARKFETRQRIAGILWNRLEIDMPLQVDAVFGYIARRGTFHPLYSDLEVDSPYNTYKNRGLPPGPIANPGLESIRAAITPIESNHFFYLTGRDGRMYYSESFDQHVVYKRLHLN